MTTKLDKLLQKEAQLKAQIQQAKAAERTLEKKHDTRRKILIGAAVMAQVESGRWPQADLLEMMDGFLSRPNERDLFDLEKTDEVAGTAAAKAAGKRPAKAKTGSKKTAGSKQGVGKKGKSLSEYSGDVENEFNL
jgi:hypothetical protein